MIQGLLYIIQLIAIVGFVILTVLFVTLAIVKRKNHKQLIVYSSLSVVFIIATSFVWNIDLYSAESSDREKAIGAFESNFGFKPPDSVEEIKVKNFGIYDSGAHWMAFTYDSIVFNKILAHDQPLDTAYRKTSKYNEIVEVLNRGCANCPDWLELPNNNTSKIYFKKHFLKCSSSEYYLWLDFEEKMVYLEISYFD